MNDVDCCLYRCGMRLRFGSKSLLVGVLVGSHGREQRVEVGGGGCRGARRVSRSAVRRSDESRKKSGGFLNVAVRESGPSLGGDGRRQESHVKLGRVNARSGDFAQSPQRCAGSVFRILTLGLFECAVIAEGRWIWVLLIKAGYT